MRFFWLFCALGALLGCRTVSEPSGTAIALFCSTDQGAKTESLTVGEEVAVYAGPEGTEDYFLEAAQFIVGSDGRSLTYGSTVYYPDPKQAVRFWAYFPYHTGVFSVPTDQSKPEALKQADLCGAVASTTPVATPVALAFEHLMARVVIQTNEPTEKISFPNAVASGVVHAATAELVLADTRSEVWTTGNELIVPVQPLSRLVLTVADTVLGVISKVEYVFDGSVALEAGKTTTLNLTLHPNTKIATLSGSSVTDWVATSTTGNLAQAVSNTLTVHWPKCHPQSNTVDRIVLTIKDEVSKITASHTVKGDFKYSDQTFTIPFASSVLHYPYTIVSVAFYQANTFLHESMSLLGGTIIKSGACVVGIRQPLNTPTADDYVTINGLNWAKGNLVAVSEENNRECKVGAPADGGLYFQFGSLIGYKGGNQDNGGTGVGMPQPPLTTNTTFWNGVGYSWASDAMVWPSELVGIKTTWTLTVGENIRTLSDYYFNYSAAPWETAEQNIRNFNLLPGTGTGTLGTGRYVAIGVGDPCTYYLGGVWRLPTTAEYKSLCNNQGEYSINVDWDVAGASWTNIPVNGGKFADDQLFFPASGFRLSLDGSFYSVAGGGYAWSSSVYTVWRVFHLHFGSSWVSAQGNSPRPYGFPVRCVSE